MHPVHLVAYFLGGMFLVNAIPHFVAGVMGEPFQTPFAKPSGEGLSSSSVNVVWGSFNIFVGYMLVCHVGAFDLQTTVDIVPFALGAFTMGMFGARAFGRFHGGNAPPPGSSRR